MTMFLKENTLCEYYFLIGFRDELRIWKSPHPEFDVDIDVVATIEPI